MAEWYRGLRRLMRERPLPRGPEEVAPLPDDEFTLHRHAGELAAIGAEARALARRAEAINLPALGYLLDVAALETEADWFGRHRAGQAQP